MEIILAGPGTGKTTKVKSIIKEKYADVNNILVLSFTNATVDDLRESFSDNTRVKCFTLHSYALIINHLPTLHVLDNKKEIPILEKYAKKLEIPFNTLTQLLSCITFKDMITGCIQFLQNNPVYAEQKIGNLNLFIVDEFQDFNEVERELVMQISKYAEKTIILGDDDQSIYSFKDADPDGIINIYKSGEHEIIEHKNICYRCPDELVKKAKKLIENNTHRIEKDWITSGKSGDVIFHQYLNQDLTFIFISNTIKEIRENDPAAKILLLSPVKYYLDELIKNLKNNNLTITNFWNTEINDNTLINIWWLKSIYSSYRLLFLLFICEKYNLLSRKPFIRFLQNSFFNNYDMEKLIEGIIDLNYLPKNLSESIMSKPELEEFFGNYPELLMFHEHLDTDNLEESVNKLEKSVNPNVKFDPTTVNLMSIHKSKGLQADYVFIYGLTEGVIPNVSDGLDSIEAYRRLLFVGMTRAERRLYLISTVEWDGKFVYKVDKSKFEYYYHNKKYRGRTSSFVDELNG